MRFILFLTAVFFLSLDAKAKAGEPVVREVKIAVVEMPIHPSLHANGLHSGKEIQLAILYKMKENIIRRELAFIPKKKWMKWV